VECFLYHFVKHEALEVEWLMPPKPVRAPGWRGCCDVRVCLELVNRWPMPIWTLFTHHKDEPSFASDDGVVLNGDANAFCSTFEASHGRGQTQRLFSLGGHAGRRPLPPTAQQDALLAQGWMRLEAGHHAGQTGQTSYGVHTICALPLAARRALVTISEFTLRLDADDWQRAEESGALVLDVLQAVDVAAVNPECGDAEVALDDVLTEVMAQEDDGQHAYASGARDEDFDVSSSAVFLRSQGHPTKLAFRKVLGNDAPTRLKLTPLRRTTAVLQL